MKSQTSERRQQAAGWTFLAPALVLIGIFFFVPVCLKRMTTAMIPPDKNAGLQTPGPLIERRL